MNALTRPLGGGERRRLLVLRGTILFLLALAGCSRPEPNAPSAPLFSSEPSALFREAERRLGRGDVVFAEQYFVAAWNGGVPGREILPRLLPVCLRENRLSSALFYAERALGEHYDARLVELVAELEVGLGQPDKALDRLRLLESGGELSTLGYFSLAGLELRHGFLDRARRAFSLYLEREPEGRHRLEALQWVRNLREVEGTPIAGGS